MKVIASLLRNYKGMFQNAVGINEMKNGADKMDC